MTELRRSLPKLLTESLLIVFSVLLALAVDEWREKRQTEQRVDQALESFAREIARNRLSVQRVLPYHERLKQHFFQLTRTPVHSIEDLRKMEGFQGFGSPALEDAAWRTATATGALADMDYETASLLSRIYTNQEGFDSIQDKILSLLQPTGLTPDTLPLTVELLAAFMEDVTLGEKGLLQGYDAAEERLKRRGIRLDQH